MNVLLELLFMSLPGTEGSVLSTLQGSGRTVEVVGCHIADKFTGNTSGKGRVRGINAYLLFAAASKLCAGSRQSGTVVTQCVKIRWFSEILQHLGTLKF